MPSTQNSGTHRLAGLALLAGTLFLLFSPLPPGADLARHRLWRRATVMFPDNVRGTVTASGSTIGSYSMHPDLCSSGERRMYFGVGFGEYEHSDYGGRVVLPVSDMPHIAIDAPGKDYAVEFYKDECKVWDVDLHRTGSTHNRIWTVAGHARFDCYHQDTGAHVAGDLNFWSCH